MNGMTIVEQYRIRNDLEFKFIENLQSKHDSSWRLDQITAYLNAEEVGHLKISYIPRERFNQNYPGILNWLAQIKDGEILPSEYRRTPWRNIPVDALRGCVYAMAQAANIGWASSCRMSEVAKTVPADTLTLMITGLERLLKRRY